jgi:peptidoglycan/xylan/chitin deacetylase (PgdA/CDA1 family)
MRSDPQFEYSPITERDFELPDDNRVALWIIPNIEYYRLDIPYPTDDSDHVPNSQSFGWRDYGTRVGVWRLIEILDKHNLRATVALNSAVCDHAPEVVEAGMERDWEYMGHGVTNSERLAGLSEKQERELIRKTRDRIKDFTGKAPRGWLSPGLTETFNTLTILSEEGFDYVGDWCNDEQPYYTEVGDPPLISMPYSVEINDIPMFLRQKMTGPDFERAIKAQFDRLYEEGAQAGNGRVMAIALHPYITGQPYRIQHLDNALEYITSHDDVWCCTGSEIADQYKQQTP